MKVTKASRATAAEEGFAIYNGGPHYIMEVPEGKQTLSIKTSGGHLLTLAFCTYEDSSHPRCVDIKLHNAGTVLNSGGQDIPTFSATMWTPGHPLYVSNAESDKEPCTLVVLSLPKVT